MRNLMSYPQRVQLALFILLASLCLNFGQLLGHFKQEVTAQVSSASHRG